ncbi:hypothetical protein Pan44_39120 [Caulifigura coniformis]|uniref:Uncharacterized protein n=1 Tax=Caulifigura coniformis TaxID=2527983 RepID=A0A517SIB3_9PLAN|nr:hypothetical protein Pan44_39120 [Caulifigura coniformis]
MATPLVSFLFTLALTALIIRSLVRFASAAGRRRTLARSLWRFVVLIVGGFVCLSLILECVRQIRML